MENTPPAYAGGSDMLNLDFDKKKFTCKFGYCTGKAPDLSDPSLHVKSQDYKRRVSGAMKAISAEDAFKLPKARGYFVSRKYDGENAMLFFDGEKMISVNPGGTARIGLPAFEEAAELLKKAKVESCILGAEIYVKEDATAAHPVQQVVRVLRSPPSKEALEKLGLAVFDVIEFDGKAVDETAKVFDLLSKWFDKGKKVHVVEHHKTDKIDEVMTYFTEWVVGQGAEGVVVRHDQAGWYKIKLRHNLDVAIIGYSEGQDARKGMLHDLLVAVMRSDGSFHEFTRVGGGFSEDERKTIAADLKKRIVPSDYVAVNNDYVAYEMIKPGPVIEISCLDMIVERARGGPVKRMVLEWDGKRYSALLRMPLVSVISPQFIRLRDDKEAVVDDVNISQVSDLVTVPEADKSAHADDDPASELMERTVYTKIMKGNMMVRKLLLWKTNKKDRDDFPAYVVYLTDFSPNRQNPLERDIKISNNERKAKQMFDELARKNFITGWDKAA
jgi:ATP-dependent DNA ligase